MPGPNGGNVRSTESRLDLLEFRVNTLEQSIADLRDDIGRIGDKMSRQTFATWMLVAALLSAAAAIFAQVR